VVDAGFANSALRSSTPIPMTVSTIPPEFIEGTNVHYVDRFR
jgi:hypothetical protein